LGRQQYKAAGVLSSASAVIAGLGVCRCQLGKLALNRGIHRNAAGQHTHLLQVIINALDKEVQLLQRFLVELFLKDGQPDM